MTRVARELTRPRAAAVAYGTWMLSLVVTGTTSLPVGLSVVPMLVTVGFVLLNIGRSVGVRIAEEIYLPRLTEIRDAIHESQRATSQRRLDDLRDHDRWCSQVACGEYRSETTDQLSKLSIQVLRSARKDWSL